jgi:uncharacterized protein (DUF4213/DUF364 family)
MNGPERVHEVYAWVLVHADGGESIATVGTHPLISPKHRLASDFMHKAAEQVLALSQSADNPGVRVELRGFEWSEPDGRG